MQMSATRRALFLLALVLAAPAGDAAPAPQPKGLHPDIQFFLEIYTRGYPEKIESIKRLIGIARTEEERASYIREVEELERKVYCNPLKVLENSLRDESYQRPEDQDAIRAALVRYRQRYEDAKRKKLFKPEPPPAPKKSPR